MTEHRSFPEEQTVGAPALIAIGVLVIRFSNLEPHLSRFYSAITNVGIEEAENLLKISLERQYDLLIKSIDVSKLSNDKVKLAKNICDRYNYISKKKDRFIHNYYIASKVSSNVRNIENIIVNSKTESLGKWVSPSFNVTRIYETIEEIQDLYNDLSYFTLDATQTLSERFPRRRPI